MTEDQNRAELKEIYETFYGDVSRIVMVGMNDTTVRLVYDSPDCGLLEFTFPREINHVADVTRIH